jgi:sugar phosphate permease
MPKSFLIWLLLSLFYAYQYIIRMVPAVSASIINERFEIDPSHFGSFCGAFHIGYTIASIPVSIIIDRCSIKKVIPCAILLSALGILPLAGWEWQFSVIGRFVSGLGAVCAIIGLFKVISIYYPGDKYSRMLGIAFTIGLLGAVFAGSPLARMITTLGFENTMVFLSFFGIFLALKVYHAIPDDLTKPTSQHFIKDILNDLKLVIYNKKLILISLAGGLMIGGLEGFTDGWSVIVFEVIHGWNRIEASAVPSVIFFGMCIGSSLLGYLTEKTQRHYSIIAFAGGVMIICFYLILYQRTLTKELLYILLSTIGACCAYKVVLLSKASAISRQEVATTNPAFVNMFLMTSGSIYHTIIGSLIHRSNKDEFGTYLAPTISSGISMIVFGMIIGVLMIVFIGIREEKSTTSSI